MRPLGIVPQTIPTSKWGTFLITLVILTSQRQNTTLTWWQELQKKFATIPTWWQRLKKSFRTAPLVFRQAKKKRRTPQVSHNFAVRTPLRQLKQTRFCWTFNNWRRTAIQPISTTTSDESRNYLNLWQQQCPHLMKNQKRSKIRKDWKSVPNNFENPQSVDGRRQNKPLPLSHAWWRSTDFQKHHQPQQREFGRILDYVP